MSEVQQQTIVSNNEKFIYSTYNNISVLIREKDGFINAANLCKQFKKRINKLYENNTWKEYYEEFIKEYYEKEGCANSHNPINSPIYILKKGFDKVQGAYVDPKLVNYIAIWCSSKYAIYVGKIMDTINDIGKTKLIDDESNMKEILNNLNSELELYKNKNKELIAKQRIDEQIIYNEGVRCNVNDRKLTIFYQDNLIKISADNNNISFKKYILQYTFPASMNIRMILKNEGLFNKMNDITNDEYINITDYLDSLNPKSRVEGLDYF